MLVFVLNAGSSSLKYQLMNPVTKKVLASGICERIGIDGVLKHEYNDGKKLVLNEAMPTHKEAINAVLTTLTSGEGKVIESTNDIEAIGHRTVHGGEEFASSVLITPEVIETMKRLSPLAPLHNPANILGIEICQELMPGKPNVGVFDTAFHQTMPDHMKCIQNMELENMVFMELATILFQMKLEECLRKNTILELLFVT